MTSVEMDLIMKRLDIIDHAIARVHNELQNKLRLDKIIDVNDDRVHKMMKIEKLFDTPNGVIVFVKQMGNIYFIPKSFPCEYCNQSIEVKAPFMVFICNSCGMEQRMTYYGKYFGMITNVK